MNKTNAFRTRFLGNKGRFRCLLNTRTLLHIRPLPIKWLKTCCTGVAGEYVSAEEDSKESLGKEPKGFEALKNSASDKETNHFEKQETSFQKPCATKYFQEKSGTSGQQSCGKKKTNNFEDFALQPYLRLPNPSRKPRRIPSLTRSMGRFVCKNCKKRYSSKEVLVTESSRKCYQGVECPDCFQSNKPYYIHSSSASIFNKRVVQPTVRAPSGKWRSIPIGILRRNGY